MSFFDDGPTSPSPRTRQTSLDANGRPRRSRQLSYQEKILNNLAEPKDPDMMGPLLRRQKVVSMPLGASATDFFSMPGDAAVAGALSKSLTRGSNVGGPTGGPSRSSLPSYPPGSGKKQAPVRKSRLSIDNLIARKQVSLDMYSPDHVEFFTPVEETVPEGVPLLDQPLVSEVIPEDEEAPQEVSEEEAKIFYPLRFAPPLKPFGGAKGHGPGQEPASAESTGEAAVKAAVRGIFEEQTRHNQELKKQIEMLTDRLEGEMDGEQEKLLEDIRETRRLVENDTRNLNQILDVEDIAGETEEEINQETKGVDGKDAGEQKDAVEKAVEPEEDDDEGIIRATRIDYMFTLFLLCIMIAFTGVVLGWHTHLDESFSTFGPVGLACATPCTGNLESQDYFYGYSSFEEGQFIQLVMEIDPNPNEVEAIAQIVGVDSGEVKAQVNLGPAFPDVPGGFVEKILVDFNDPEEYHIINVTSADPDVILTYKLHATTMSPMAQHSVLIAALIMVFVYIFILLEVIHRTLVAIFGSMIALLFFFLIHEGETESIKTIMLHMEWSTLGLLFGMMLIVGELSHTGIFEWMSVRILVASKGSYNRLMVLLCLLTAVASAFLDNVTTMLLIAPVTIDMCSILNVDPRPYLIGEVLLSNVGGTATLIGDPPNIIIGSAFEEIGFVDFIINVLPCIFLLCIPVSIGTVLYLYRYYMTSTKMPELDKPKLMRTYRVYDEPRLLIAGTVTFFVILIFFLHPVHHKDTAWIALFGAFITIAFTNPHDVQDALRNHVEWDTLLFFAGLFVLVEVCAALGLLAAIGQALANLISAQEEEKQLTVAITLILWVSAITSAFLDNIPYTATMIPVVRILHEQLPDTLPLETLAWALSFGACLGGNGTLLGASANIVTAGIATNRGYAISFVNFFYPGMIVMLATVALANIYMLCVYVWI